MFLMRQPGAGFDRDALGLEWVAVVSRLIGYRRAEHSRGRGPLPRRRARAAYRRRSSRLATAVMHQNREFALIYDPLKRSDSPKE